MTISQTRQTTPPLLRSRHEARAMLGIGLTTLDSLLNEGKLTRIKIGRRTLITDDSVRRFIEESALTKVESTQ